MTFHDFFVGGTALRIAIFLTGLWFCWKYRTYKPWSTALCHVGSITVLVLLLISREWATILGVPVSALVVERLTRGVELKKQVTRLEAEGKRKDNLNQQLMKTLRRKESNELSQ